LHFLHIKLFHDGSSGPELFSHVHGPAALGETGPICFTMDTSIDKTECFEMTKDHKKDLDDELWYVDRIHCEKCPNDAIRGQILPLTSNVGTIVKKLRQIRYLNNRRPGDETKALWLYTCRSIKSKMTDDDDRRFYRFAPAPGATAATVSAASPTIDSSALAAAISGGVPGLIHHCPDLAGQSDKKWIVLPVPS
jgi:hypothetical protein